MQLKSLHATFGTEFEPWIVVLFHGICMQTCLFCFVFYIIPITRMNSTVLNKVKSRCPPVLPHADTRVSAGFYLMFPCPLFLTFQVPCSKRLLSSINVWVSCLLFSAGLAFKHIPRIAYEPIRAAELELPAFGLDDGGFLREQARGLQCFLRPWGGGIQHAVPPTLILTKFCCFVLS